MKNNAESSALVGLMLDRKWRTVQRISDITGIPTAQVFAQLRDLKKDSEKYAIDRKPKDDTFKYRIRVIEKVKTPEFFNEYPKSVIKRFKKFNRKNPNVFKQFVELAFKMLQTGRAKYSARTIIEVMRWERDLQTVGEVFKINDNYTPIYVRMLIHENPEFGDFFELRRVRSRGLKSAEQVAREGLLEVGADKH
jgi:hypothetical protein